MASLLVFLLQSLHPLVSTLSLFLLRPFPLGLELIVDGLLRPSSLIVDGPEGECRPLKTRDPTALPDPGTECLPRKPYFLTLPYTRSTLYPPPVAERLE